jgi:hypothetical protein
VAHGASALGISTVELLIDDNRDNSIRGTRENDSIITYSRDCSDMPPGEYLLRLRVQDKAGNWSRTAETSLSIVESRRPTPLPPPPAIDTPRPPGGVRNVAIESISTNPVYAGADTCGPVDVIITARATAPKGIAVVVLFYRVEPSSPGGYANAVMAPIGGDLYQATISPNSILDGAAEGALRYQVVVQQGDGDTSIRTPVMEDIAVQPCGKIGAPDCTRYSDKRTCESHGCKWVLLPAIVPVYACGNP